jgi:hypothetical protein
LCTTGSWARAGFGLARLFLGAMTLRVAVKQRRHGYATAVRRALARTTEDVVIDLDQPVDAPRGLLRRRPRLPEA